MSWTHPLAQGEAEGREQAWVSHGKEGLALPSLCRQHVHGGSVCLVAGGRYMGKGQC